MASKLTSLGTAVLFRSSTRALFLPKLSAHSSLRPSLPRLCCSSVAAQPPAPELAEPRHPWTEWVEFVDRLTDKGYFSENSLSAIEEEGERLYRDVNLLKDACLSFGRDRYDLLNSLSKKDLKVVVGSGCPNLLRKGVNSAKRLRNFVNLDEADVCGGCNLRGSCDRAYVILKESESNARTVDIVRLLLFYAVDPALTSGAQKPAGREVVESSARKLLSELLHLSETARDPALDNSAAHIVKRKERPSSRIDHELFHGVEMMKGDWKCNNCEYMNFSRNSQCLKCKENRPNSFGKTGIKLKEGDWTCPECRFMNFSRNKSCMKCKAEGPNNSKVKEFKMKKGDWNCPRCEYMNFASNRECLRCKDSRPKRILKPGEWECPACDFLNYSANATCLKCDYESPHKTKSAEYDEHAWRRPR